MKPEKLSNADRAGEEYMALEINVSLPRFEYPMVIGTAEEILAGAPGSCCRNRDVFLAIDANADRCFPDFAPALAAVAARCEKYTVPAGEENKTPETVIGMCRAAAAKGFGRDAVFAAVGGGVTGDMTAFAASIYMRGVPCVQFPTTLLAMLDSSIGGKTGCDLPEGKNLAGTFHQPLAVGMALDFLKTLPAGEMVNGLGEAAKYALGFDAELFNLFEKQGAEISDEFIFRCASIKAQIVAGDEKESAAASKPGVRSRELLNLGHTFAHALESATDFAVPHGSAVGTGCLLACDLAVRRGVMTEAEKARVHALWPKLGLSGKLPCKLHPADLVKIMRRDKKRRAGQHRLVIPRSIGDCFVINDVAEEELTAVWEAVC